MAIAVALPRPEPAFELVLAPAIELPPVDLVPESVRPAMRRYAADASAPARAALVVELDRVGHGWEQAIASRALQARAELIEACRRLEELPDELVDLQAAARCLSRFPWRSSWDPEPTPCTWPVSRSP